MHVRGDKHGLRTLKNTPINLDSKCSIIIATYVYYTGQYNLKGGKQWNIQSWSELIRQI